MRSKMHPFQRNLCSNIKWEKKKTFKKESNWTSADLMPFDRWKRERERECRKNTPKNHFKSRFSLFILSSSFRCLWCVSVCFFFSYFYSTRLLAFTPFLCAMFFFLLSSVCPNPGHWIVCVCIFFSFRS